MDEVSVRHRPNLPVRRNREQAADIHNAQRHVDAIPILPYRSRHSHFSMTNKILELVTTGLLSLVPGCGSKPSNSAAGSAAAAPVAAATVGAQAETRDPKH